MARWQKPHIKIHPCQHSAIPHTRVLFGVNQEVVEGKSGDNATLQAEEAPVCREGPWLVPVVTNRRKHLSISVHSWYEQK